MSLSTTVDGESRLITRPDTELGLDLPENAAKPENLLFPVAECTPSPFAEVPACGSSPVKSPLSMAGKPVHLIDRKSILKRNPAFAEKQLCDGWTFTAGDACVFRCSYCYVGAQFARDSTIRSIGGDHSEKVVRRKDPVGIARFQLIDKRGRPRFAGAEEEGRVIFASPLVDVAANLELVDETVALCRLILTLTKWHIRLLSKSSLLPRVAAGLAGIPEARERMIYGCSTGTLDDRLAASFELGTARVSRRYPKVCV